MDVGKEGPILNNLISIGRGCKSVSFPKQKQLTHNLRFPRTSMIFQTNIQLFLHVFIKCYVCLDSCCMGKELIMYADDLLSSLFISLMHLYVSVY